MLDSVVAAFASGYNGMLSRDPAELGVERLSARVRGFAYEGAAMSAVILDLVAFGGGRRLRELDRVTGGRYVHLLLVGAGWAFARLRLRPWRGVRFGPPVLRWLAWDGWGFHQAFFHPVKVFGNGWIEARVPEACRAIRDQGAGRALWFYAGAEPTRVAEVIDGLPAGRRADLWAGIGLAAAYTGAQSPEALNRLVTAGESYAAALAQGAAFAAKAHLLSGIVTDETASAVQILTGVDVPAAARWTDDALAALDGRPDTPETYEAWRAGVRHAWASTLGEVTR
ncbi:enediyne biosynthesis protein [Herbidospora sp. NBRC 101105]|nr:enediyne biosynthesis protein [Herbidospora sp. NBRC 101105]